MKHKLLTIIAGLMIFPASVMAQSCSKSTDKGNTPDEGIKKITVMTYNVGAFQKYMKDSEPLIAKIIRENNANIVSLNELDSCNTRCGLGSFPLRTLANDLGGWNYHFSSAMAWSQGAYGNGITCSPKLKPIATYTVSLPKSDGSEKRSMSVIEFEKFVFASTHLDYKGEDAPMVQAEKITGWCSGKFGKSGKTVILCGDFNCTPDSKVIRYFGENWSIISPYEATFPSKGSCIDYIMVLKNGASYKVQESSVCTQSEAGDIYKASDHLPIKAVIVF